MTINIKNLLSLGKKISKMGDFQEVKHIEGLQVSAISANLYKNEREDLSLFYFPEGANYAVAYTKNSIVSESIIWNRENTKSNIKALVVNTKNANTFTGEQGQSSLNEIAKNLIDTLKKIETENGYEKSKIKDLLFASTGVIGEKFPVKKIEDNIENLVSKLKKDHNKLVWVKAASAIMTTDTKPKLAYEEFHSGSKTIKIAGIAKGSGMIAPNLATMLSFIFTDADIPSNILKSTLKKALASSFNAITVDNDQSTNDMVTIFSTGVKKIGQNRGSEDPLIKKFEIALKNVCLNLAKQIVVDGEGAKKFVTIKVLNARSHISAKKIAFSIADSPLVKTAIAGEDPNWGRIIMGMGKSGEEVDSKKIIIRLGDFTVAEKGKISESYDEEKLKEYMKNDLILITIDLKQGKEEYECYTCDFTHDYIDINAHYRRS